MSEKLGESDCLRIIDGMTKRTYIEKRKEVTLIKVDIFQNRLKMGKHGILFCP